MSTIQISRAARTAVESALTSRFNTYVAVACTDYGIADQVFEIDFANPGTNYWRAAFDATQIRETVTPNEWPCMALSVASVTDTHEMIGVTFDGPVTIRLSVFYRWQDPAQADMESLPEAVESVAVTLLESIDGLRQGSLVIERDPPEFINDCWYVAQHISAEYQITA